MPTKGPAPDLRDVLRDLLASWHRDAACQDEPTETFFPDPSYERRLPGGPTVVTPLLFCERCPVRRPCLAEGFRVWAAPVRSDYQVPESLRFVATITTVGVWGGSSDRDRWGVRHLPVDEAIEVLDRTFHQRLEARIAAFRRGSMKGRWAERLGAMLAEREATVYTHASVTRRRVLCGRCRGRLPAGRRDRVYCSVRCRVAAHRARVAA
jgi:hypothetical protein